MFDTLNGLPAHPLVVHAVVVLFPLAILGTLLIAIRPRWRVRYGPLVVAATSVASVACGVQVYRVGDSGARAAWGDVGAVAPDAP